MNPRINTIARLIIITATCLGCPQAINAQIPDWHEFIYSHDQSGNLTATYSLFGIGAYSPSGTQTITVGGKIYLNVFPGGNGPFTYQWLRNGAYIWDATSEMDPKINTRS